MNTLKTHYCTIILLLFIYSTFTYGQSKLMPTSRSRFQLQMMNSFNIFSFMKKESITDSKKTNVVTKADTVKKYFNNWNIRDMNNAIECFAEDCIYEDTLYPKVFKGKNEVKSHLLNVASSLPKSFQFVIDEISEDSNNGNVGIQWHVESDQKPLPFTRGSSMYTIDDNGYIIKGFDVPEPTLKSGSFSLSILKLAKNLISDNKRVIPLVGWIIYCWLLFFSNIAPGLNALSLDPHTWQEVKELSLNFWLVLPILSPNTAPIQHPILESIFNIVLVWSGLFIGFVIDGKQPQQQEQDNDVVIENPNKMSNTILGMQFLTNALFLPYLITRDPEDDKIIRNINNNNNNNDNNMNYNKLSTLEQIGESKLLPIVLGILSIISIYWGINGRYDSYGDITTRFASFYDILKNDRLTFSFIIDLLYYSYFQNWLVEDDLKRRNITIDNEQSNIYKNLKVISTIPLFGLIIYLINRPSLTSKENLNI